MFLPRSYVIGRLCTSTILVSTGDQDPTVHLTQSFWVVVALPILVANQIWKCLVKYWEPSINPVLFLFWLNIIWRIMMTHHSLPLKISVFEEAAVWTHFFLARPLYKYEAVREAVGTRRVKRFKICIYINEKIVAMTSQLWTHRGTYISQHMFFFENNYQYWWWCLQNAP